MRFEAKVAYESDEFKEVEVRCGDTKLTLLVAGDGGWTLAESHKISEATWETMVVAEGSMEEVKT